jgi:hypothetical protein
MLDGLIWALVAALLLGLVGWVVRTPARRYARQVGETNRKIADDATHRLILASGRGYTLRLVSESGDEIGVQKGGRFHPDFYRRPGATIGYGGTTYDVLSVEDDYPAATGTLVLRRSETSEGRAGTRPS